MFIPTGEIIHESLATSYVLVDALCADLCEGGFSGCVEVVLRDTDSFIVIFNGNVSGVIEKSGGNSNGGTASAYSRTTVEGLAERSRLERGRVSIYGYPAAIANAVARRINAQPLYVGLSTEFTDLEKMISKLLREREREWFIEVNTEDGPRALIHMLDCECRIIGATGVSDTGALDLAGNPALAHLIDECNRCGGTYDVYFTQPGADVFHPIEPAPPQHTRTTLPAKELITNHRPFDGQPGTLEHAVEANSHDAGTSEAPTAEGVAFETETEVLQIAAEDDKERLVERTEEVDVSIGAMAAVAATQAGFVPATEIAEPALREDFIEPQAGDLSIVRDELAPATPDVETMAEIKRLMGEIARAIEEAAQSVGRPDGFSMSLRAGQLEIADRFPFLDPFAGEFEYLAGEIVFVGNATAEVFIEGLTEALILAIEAVTRSTAYADRFRSYVSEDLQKLLARGRADFERFGVDRVIQQIAASESLVRD